MIGTHILARLADRPGLSVTAVCHNRSAQVTAANIDSVAADAADADDLAERIDGADYVLVAAGILATAPVLAADPVGPVLRNLRIVTGALEAAYRVRCRKCVWLSSTTGFPPVEEDEGNSVEERASDVRSESESGVARPPAEREGEAGVGTDEEAAGRAAERVEDVSSGASVGASPPRVPSVGSDDDELDALLESATIGEARVAAGGFGSGGGSTRAAAKPPPATSAEDDDAFLDELLGES